MVTGLGAPNWGALLSGLLAAPTVSVPAVGTKRTVPVSVTAAAGQAFIGWSSGVGTPPACTGATSTTPPTSVTVPGDGPFVVWVEGYLAKSRCLLAEASTTVDTVKPSVVPAAHASSQTAKKVTFSWKAADRGSGVASVAVTVLRNGKAIWSGTTAGSSSVTLKGQLGSVYRIKVTAVDRAGNTTQVSKGLDVAYDDHSLTLSKGWKRVKSHAAFGGSLVSASTKGAKAKVTAYGTTYSLITTLCKDCGVVQVYVNGKHYRDINLYSKASRAQRVVKLLTTGSARRRTITFVVKGGNAAKGRGTTVLLDGLLVS
jgi:hypothetical protein